MAKRIVDLTETSGIDLSGYFAEIDKSGLSESVCIDLKNLLRGLVDSGGEVRARAGTGGLEVNAINRMTPSGTGKVAYPVVQGHQNVYKSFSALGVNPAIVTIPEILSALESRDELLVTASSGNNNGLGLPASLGVLLIRQTDGGQKDIRFMATDTENGAIYTASVDGSTVTWACNGALLIGETYRSGGSWVNKYKLRQYTTLWSGLSNSLQITHNLNTTNYIASINVLENGMPKKFTYNPDANILYIYVESVSDVEDLRVKFKVEDLGNLITL